MKKYVNQIKQKIVEAFNRLPPKQRVRLILGLLLGFVIADAVYIWYGFTGNASNIDSEIRHIEPLPLPKQKHKEKTVDSQPNNTNYEKRDSTK